MRHEHSTTSVSVQEIQSLSKFKSENFKKKQIKIKFSRKFYFFYIAKIFRGYFFNVCFIHCLDCVNMQSYQSLKQSQNKRTLIYVFVLINFRENFPLDLNL